MTISRSSFAFVADLVRHESAIVLGDGKEYLVESRLLPLARAAGHRDVDSYVGDLQARRSTTALRQVVEALTTNETSWFRDGDPFGALKTIVFPELARARPRRELRVWSAACSSGQEAYSVAMTAAESPVLAGWRVEVVGTDLSEEMVVRARTGEYSQLEVNRGLPATTLVKHFQRAGTGWRIHPALQKDVSFQVMNLIRPFPSLGGTFDVVFLRNVLIYFDLPTKRDILRRVRERMAPDGYLFLGAAEMTMGVDDTWDRIPAGRSSVYQPRQHSSVRAG